MTILWLQRSGDKNLGKRLALAALSPVLFANRHWGKTMDCRHEHEHHGHDHNDDDHIAPPNTNEAQTLYPYIDVPNVRALNAEEPELAHRIVRNYDDRLSEDPTLSSDADEELLIVIPFTGLVKLHSVLIRSLGDESAPKTIKLFKDRPDLDFQTVEDANPVQTLNFPENVGAGITTEEGSNGIVEFAVNRTKFTNMTSLVLHIPENYGADQTKLTYIGLRGEWSELRQAPVIATYEASAQPGDHKIETAKLRKASRMP